MDDSQVKGRRNLAYGARGRLQEHRRAQTKFGRNFAVAVPCWDNSSTQTLILPTMHLTLATIGQIFFLRRSFSDIRGCAVNSVSGSAFWPKFIDEITPHAFNTWTDGYAEITFGRTENMALKNTYRTHVAVQLRNQPPHLVVKQSESLGFGFHQRLAVHLCVQVLCR
jgi:hypothetical protein